jgi:hypothetical protein
MSLTGNAVVFIRNLSSTAAKNRLLFAMIKRYDELALLVDASGKRGEHKKQETQILALFSFAAV